MKKEEGKEEDEEDREEEGGGRTNYTVESGDEQIKEKVFCLARACGALAQPPFVRQQST